MFFVVPTPSYPRVGIERIFKALYGLGNMVHIFSIVVLMTEFYNRLESSMPNYFTSSNFTMSKPLDMMMKSCNYSDFANPGRKYGSVSIARGPIEVPLMTIAQYTIGVLVVEFLAVLNNALCALNYTNGNRHLRFFGVHVPLYHITVAFAYGYAIILIVMVLAIRPWQAFYSEVVRECEKHLRLTNYTALLEVEYDNYHIFDTPLIWALVASLINIIFSLCGCIVLILKSRDPAVVLLSESNAPWEGRNLLCSTNKAALGLHTKARETILEEARAAMSRGERVRIVRSYALMTEEDFEAQVEAMRQHFADDDREQQFQQLREYFGPQDSAIEQEGLLWRRRPSSSPPLPPASLPGFHGNASRIEIPDAGESFGMSGPRKYNDPRWRELGDTIDVESEMSPFDTEDADDGGETPYAEFPRETPVSRHHKKPRRHRHHRHHEDTMSGLVPSPGPAGDRHGRRHWTSSGQPTSPSPVPIDNADSPVNFEEADEL